MLKANQKKNENMAEKHIKAIQNLSKWDEYRIRKETLVNMLYEAKQRLAMKKAWVHMTSFHSIIM